MISQTREVFTVAIHIPDLYYSDPAQHVITAGYDLSADDLFVDDLV